MDNLLTNAKKFAANFSTDRSLDAQIIGSSSATIKFYNFQSHTCSALFAIITLGDSPNAPRIINVFGKFDHSLIGGSTNFPPELINASTSASTAQAISNPLLRQLIVYKNDAAGAFYFSRPDSSPPPCEEFNYMIMILSDGSSDSFGIKASSWKFAEADVYSFKISELTKIEEETDVLAHSSSWCKSVLPSASVNLNSSSTAAAAVSSKEPSNGTKALIVILIILGFFALVALERYFTNFYKK